MSVEFNAAFFSSIRNMAGAEKHGELFKVSDRMFFSQERRSLAINKSEDKRFPMALILYSPTTRMFHLIFFSLLRLVANKEIFYRPSHELKLWIFRPNLLVITG